MPQPTKQEIANRMRKRYGSQMASTHTGGGKNHMRRKKFRNTNRTTNDFEKRMQSSLQKLGCSTIPGIEEVNLFKDDGTVIHVAHPKVDAEVQSNTFIISGNFKLHKIEDLLPGILPQMGAESLSNLKDFASTFEALKPTEGDSDDDDNNVPLLVSEDMNFEQVAADEEKELALKLLKDSKEADIENNENKGENENDENDGNDANADENNENDDATNANDNNDENKDENENDDENNAENDENANKKAVKPETDENANKKALKPETEEPANDEAKIDTAAISLPVDEQLILDSKCAPLLSNLDLFDSAEKAAICLLLQCNQTHIFAEWPLPGVDDQSKRALLQQILRLNAQYGPGLRQYYETGLKLIKESFANSNPYRDYTPSIPDGIKLEFDSAEFHEYELLGKSQYAYTGFILVAGGLGERLGYHGTKIGLPVDITSDICYLEYYIRFILAMQAEANRTHEDIILPLTIMISNETNAETIQLLTDNNNYGMVEGQISLVKQELVPTFIDNEGKFGMKSKYVLGEKPHGHGDIHALLYKDSIINNWRTKYKTKWLIFFQDTNGVAFRSLPSTIGVSLKHDYAMNSVSVPRIPGEAMGSITKLTKDGESLTVNVEYNQLLALLEADVADEDGFSKYPGNVNTFVIEVEKYLRTMADCKGLIPEFINPKYVDDTKTAFLKPTRLECMMQEYPKLLGMQGNVGITCFPKWFAFKPVKANISDSKAQISKIGSSFSAASGEAAMYKVNRALMCNMKEGEREFAGISVPYGARIVLFPSFGTTVADIRNKVKGQLNISQKSTLVLEGNFIQIVNGLTLDGTLVVRALNGSHIVLDGLVIKNDGWTFEDINVDDESIDEKYRIRGYQLCKSENEDVERNARIICFDDGKEHVLKV